MALLLITAAIVYITNQTLITHEILSSEFSRYLDDETAYEMAEKNLTITRQLVKLGIALVIVLLKVFFFTGVIWVGLLFLKANYSVYELLEVVAKGYFVFLLLDITKFIWFFFFETDYTFSILNSFNPFSIGFMVAEIFPAIDNLFVKIISRIDLFDIIFCFAVTH